MTWIKIHLNGFEGRNNRGIYPVLDYLFLQICHHTEKAIPHHTDHLFEIQLIFNIDCINNNSCSRLLQFTVTLFQSEQSHCIAVRVVAPSFVRQSKLTWRRLVNNWTDWARTNYKINTKHMRITSRSDLICHVSSFADAHFTSIFLPIFMLNVKRWSGVT